eukprot:5876371-Lingulodinium_polyedra.AAC.1
MTAEKPNWKQLSELPKVDIPAGEAWERNAVLITWQTGCRISLHRSICAVLRCRLQYDESSKLR